MVTNIYMYIMDSKKLISIKKLNIGSNYNITQGPFKGYMGKVVRLNRNKIKLELPNLGIIVLLKAA